MLLNPGTASADPVAAAVSSRLRWKNLAERYGDPRKYLFYWLKMSEPEKQRDPSAEPVWERKLIERLALESVVEQRRKRRWGIFFKLGFLVLAFVAIAALWTVLT